MDDSAEFSLWWWSGAIPGEEPVPLLGGVRLTHWRLGVARSHVPAGIGVTEDELWPVERLVDPPGSVLVVLG